MLMASELCLLQNLIIGVNKYWRPSGFCCKMIQDFEGSLMEAFRGLLVDT
jgi:hypothetical protein